MLFPSFSLLTTPQHTVLQSRSPRPCQAPDWATTRARKVSDDSVPNDLRWCTQFNCFSFSHTVFSLSFSLSFSFFSLSAFTAAVCSRNSYHTNMTSVLGKLALVVGSAFRHGDEGFKMPEEHLRVFGNECRHTTQMNAHTTQKQTNVDIQIRISMQHAHHKRSMWNLTICVFVCVFVCARFWLQRGGRWQGSVENGNVHLHVPCKCMHICIHVYACLSPTLCGARKISHGVSLAQTLSHTHQTPWMPPAFGFSIPRYADPRERSYVGMQVCVHVYTYLMYIRAHQYVHILLYMCVYIYTHNLLHVFVYINTCIYIYTHLQTYMYTRIHTYMCMHVYMIYRAMCIYV